MNFNQWIVTTSDEVKLGHIARALNSTLASGLKSVAQAPRQLTSEQRQALRDVISYNWNDELDDFRHAVAQGDIEADDDGHVFVKLVKLENFLSAMGGEAADYIEDSN